MPRCSGNEKGPHREPSGEARQAHLSTLRKDMIRFYNPVNRTALEIKIT
jgi:hypothetical protein